MKYLNILLILFSSFGTFAQEQENSKLISHGIYAELFGAAIHGSVGYKMSLNFKPNLITNGYVGIGAIISPNTNAESALMMPIGISQEFRFAKFMSVEGGIFGTAYFNYTGNFTNETKDCYGMTSCPPDNTFFLTTFLGTNFFIKEFSICPRMDMFLPHFRSNKVMFWPSLALRYTFSQKKQG